VRGGQARRAVSTRERIAGHGAADVGRRLSFDAGQLGSVHVAAAADARRRRHHRHVLHVQETAFSSRVTSLAAHWKKETSMAVTLQRGCIPDSQRLRNDKLDVSLSRNLLQIYVIVASLSMWHWDTSHFSIKFYMYFFIGLSNLLKSSHQNCR